MQPLNLRHSEPFEFRNKQLRSPRLRD
jgi:hypothetical protein